MYYVCIVLYLPLLISTEEFHIIVVIFITTIHIIFINVRPI